MLKTFSSSPLLLPLGEELKMRAKEWAWERIEVRAIRCPMFPPTLKLRRGRRRFLKSDVDL
jgi:hypothetical protein